MVAIGIRQVGNIAAMNQTLQDQPRLMVSLYRHRFDTLRCDYIIFDYFKVKGGGVNLLVNYRRIFFHDYNFESLSRVICSSNNGFHK